MILLFVALCLLDSALATVVTDFVLVDTTSSSDLLVLKDDSIVDTSIHGDQLSIRIETTPEVETIKLDLDEGSTIRIFNSSPVYLAGRKGGDNTIFPSNTIARPGKHTLKACSVQLKTNSLLGEKKDQSNCQTISFKTIHGDVKEPKPEPETTEPSFVDIDPIPISAFGKVSGELLQWHRVTIGFRGPPASETGMTVPGVHRAPTPFADYRLDVTFEHEPTNQTYVVPGYFVVIVMLLTLTA